MDCVRGLIFDGGECVDPGFDCAVGGVPTTWGCSPADCGAGYVLVASDCRTTCDGGVIVDGSCLPVHCENGVTWNGTECVASGSACPPAQILLNGVCTPLGFQDLPQLELRPELIDPGIVQAIPQFPGN